MKSLIKKITPEFLLNFYYSMWPFLGAFIYRSPSRKMKVIGITGTNGKTTVTHLTTHILESAGYKVASISSLRFKIAGRQWKNELKMTMPGRMRIQKFLHDARLARCEFVVMEVTSEGIKQKRHKFIKFDAVVFTNLTPEHIESHGSFENYKKAKGELFASSHRISIVNIDDKYSDYFLNFPTEIKITYSIKNEEAKASSLLGEFNKANSLAAVSIARAYGINEQTIQKALQSFGGVPGRMEVVIHQPFRVVVDYAHTPDALRKVYETLTESYKLPRPSEALGEGGKANSSRMICVLGAAGGGRDKWKRPEFGKIAGKYCDEIILTNEDPYDEDPASILEQIETGSSQIAKILDRREAINEALKRAKQGDTVIITGKGAEPWMVVAGGRKIPWDDREVVREEFEGLVFKGAARPPLPAS